MLSRAFALSANEKTRNNWLEKTLLALPAGSRILDAGAGELRNKPICAHLNYVAQDFCQYDGQGDGRGLQTGAWTTDKIDLVCDITDIPEPDASFDAILCSEVFEHLPDPLKALDEFARLLKPGGKLILTAPFASLVHFAPYHFASGFSRYWYEHHLPIRGFEIQELTANGDWFACLKQELLRLPSMARRSGDKFWPFAYIPATVGLVYFALQRPRVRSDDVACFGWHCVAIRRPDSTASEWDK
jgi:ubiquinone/menaquinone biosynthesis C-methylase UbiE